MYLVHKADIRAGTGRKHSLGSPGCQLGWFKGTLFCLSGFLTTGGRDAHFIGRKNIIGGLYFFKKLKVKNQYFFLKKLETPKLDIGLDLIQNLMLATKVTRLSSRGKKYGMSHQRFRINFVKSKILL